MIILSVVLFVLAGLFKVGAYFANRQWQKDHPIEMAAVKRRFGPNAKATYSMYSRHLAFGSLAQAFAVLMFIVSLILKAF